MSLQKTGESRPLILLVTLGLVTTSPGIPAAAPEYLVDEQPVPASVEDERTPMEEAYLEEPGLPSVFPRLRERLDDAAPFWRDT